MRNKSMTSVPIALGFILAATVSFTTATPASAAKFVLVTDYGAKGDGVTDDTIAIATAIAVAKQQRDAIVLFGPGDYLITQGILVDSVALTGTKATITAGNTAGRFQLAGSHASMSNLIMNSKVKSLDTVAITIVGTDADITSCNIQGNFGIGIFVLNGSRVRIEDNTFHLTQGGDNSAITATGCTGLTVSSNMISGISQTGFGITIDNSTDAKVAGNTVLELHNGIIGRTSPGISVSGSKATDCLYGVLIESCNKATVSGNDFGGTSSVAGVAITCNTSADAHISENDIVHYTFGINPYLDDNARITKNVITNTTTSIFVASCNNVEVTDNDLSGGTGFGIGVQNGYGTVSRNKINGMGNQGILAVSAVPNVRISNNDLKNCGLVGGNGPQTVIYQNSPGASTIEIIDNTYSGNAQNLQYYIWDVQASPPSVVTGNRNSTLLPNRIGS